MPRPCPHAPAAAKPCRHRRPACSPPRRAQSPAPAAHRVGSGRSVAPVRVDTPHGVDSPTPKVPRCLSMKPSGLESAVEFRLGQKHIRPFENPVGTAQFLDLALQCAMMRGASIVVTPGRWPVHGFMPTHPSAQGECRAAESWRLPIRWPPSVTGGWCDIRQPGARRACGLKGGTLRIFCMAAPSSQELKPS